MLRYCPDCAQDRPVEAPVCSERHGDFCPDLMCSSCSSALVQASLSAA